MRSIGIPCHADDRIDLAQSARLLRALAFFIQLGISMINPYRAGLALGVFLALWHACWSTLVALGLAQALTDFVFWAHFISPVYHIEPFDISRAAILVAFVFMVGLIVGTVATAIWNAFRDAR